MVLAFSSLEVGSFVSGDSVLLCDSVDFVHHLFDLFVCGVDEAFLKDFFELIFECVGVSGGVTQDVVV